MRAKVKDLCYHSALIMMYYLMIYLFKKYGIRHIMIFYNNFNNLLKLIYVINITESPTLLYITDYIIIRKV